MEVSWKPMPAKKNLSLIVTNLPIRAHVPASGQNLTGQRHPGVGELAGVPHLQLHELQFSFFPICTRSSTTPQFDPRSQQRSIYQLSLIVTNYDPKPPFQFDPEPRI